MEDTAAAHRSMGVAAVHSIDWAVVRPQENKEAELV
jgi:hypothetical protein